MKKKQKVGNAATMREALIEIEKMAHCDLCNVYPKYRNKFDNLVGGIERIARAALSAPARNCDVGTPDEQAERFIKHCQSFLNRDGSKACVGCPCCGVVMYGKCELAWAQTPYTADEGGAE